MKKITLLVASSGKNQELAKALAGVVENQKAKAHTVHLESLDLPLYTGKEEQEKGVPVSIKPLLDELQSSRA